MAATYVHFKMLCSLFPSRFVPRSLERIWHKQIKQVFGFILITCPLALSGHCMFVYFALRNCVFKSNEFPKVILQILYL